MTNTDTILTKYDVLLSHLNKFYSVKKNFIELCDTLDKTNKKKISLRIVEWFYSSYSKRKSVEYTVNGKTFNVYKSYKEQLKSFQKKYFDPFKRMDGELDQKIEIKLFERELVTTISQLNFFRWCIKNKVLIYIREHLNDIKNDMLEMARIKNVNKQPTTPKTAKKSTYKTTTTNNKLPTSGLKVANKTIIEF